MQYTNTAYKTAVQKLPQNYRMEIEVIFDAETEDLLYPLLCETGENLETEKGEVLEYAESAERIVIPPDDIFEAGFSEAVFLSTFCVGSSVAADFWVRVFNKDGKYKDDALAKAEIRPHVTLYDETGTVTDTVSVGVFFVNKITVQNSDLRLECIDKMRYLEKPYIVKKSALRLYQIMQDIALSVRGSFETTSAEISTLNRFVFDTIFDGYTKRQVVELIAEACGSFAVFNAEGNLELRWFKNVPIELRGDWAKNALELNGNTFSLDGNVVQVTGVRIINEDTELAEVGTDEYLLTINENPITVNSSEIFAERILERLSTTKYIPCKWQRIGGDPSLQVGDIVTVIDNEEPYNEADYDSYDKYPLYMTSRSWTYNCGGFSDTYCAAGNAERDLNTDRGMTQSKRISRLAKRITEADNALSELTDRETALLLFNEQMFNSMGLYKTVKDRGNGGVIVYYHDKTELENSGTIYMFGTSGFAWTTDGWNDGEPLWNYGFTGAGDAILNTIHAYIISADLIKTGLLQSQNGASWISLDDGTFCFRSATPEGVDLDTGEAIYSYEDKLKLDESGELGVYGTLRNTNYSNFSVSVGPSERGSGGAFTVTDSTNGWGNLFQVYGVSNSTEKGTIWTAPFLLNSAKTNRKGIAVFPHDISIFNDNYGKQTHVSCREGTVDITNSTVNLQLYRDNIMLTNNDHPWVYFNYFAPEKGVAPQKYGFGNGTNGGRAGIECGAIDSTGEVKCTSVNSSGYGIFNGSVTVKSRVIAGGTSYWTDSMLSVNGIATAHSWDVVSDPDMKTNIVKQDGLKALDKVTALKFYSYDLKEGVPESQKAHTDIGLMADEAPTEIQSSDGKGIDLYAYISLTAKALQELSEKVEQQAQEIAQLKAELSALKQ